ncbi:MAG: hypothetical protein GY765_12290 [bacterium]|nr:hypothetical protein [bacterium]
MNTTTKMKKAALVYLAILFLGYIFTRAEEPHAGQPSSQNVGFASGTIAGNTPKTLFNSGDELHVLSVAGLNLRPRKDFKGRALRKLEYGKKVRVVHAGQNLPLQPSHTADAVAPHLSPWVRGKWICARYKDYEGYIFDGYLSPLPAPQRKRKKRYRNKRLFSVALRDYVIENFKTVNTQQSDENFSSAGEGPPYRESPSHSEEARGKQIRDESGDEDAYIVTLRLENGFTMICHCWPGAQSTEFIMKNLRLTDAYNLAAALVYAYRLDKSVLKDLIFVRNRQGEIYKVTGRKHKYILIKRTHKDTVSLKMTLS